MNGFKLQSVEVKLLAYSNAVALFCRNLESVTEVVSLTKNVCEESGTAVNWSESCGFFLRGVERYFHSVRMYSAEQGTLSIFGGSPRTLKK